MAVSHSFPSVTPSTDLDKFFSYLSDELVRVFWKGELLIVFLG